MPREKSDRHEIVKNKILMVAEELFVSGGVEAVSIRVIARKIGYSPSNIYKYFASKEEIIIDILSRRMRDIVKSIEKVEDTNVSTKAILVKGFKAHFNNVMKYKEHYKTVMLSSEKMLLERTAMLNRENVRNLPAIMKLVEHLKRGIEIEEFRDFDPLLLAQIIWSNMFGLIIRVIVEGFNDFSYIDLLIEEYFDMVFKGLSK